MTRQRRVTLEELADKIATKWYKPFEGKSRTYQGEMFYSDVIRLANNAGYKKVTHATRLFRALEQRGFWLHS